MIAEISEFEYRTVAASGEMQVVHTVCGVVIGYVEDREQLSGIIGACEAHICPDQLREKYDNLLAAARAVAGNVPVVLPVGVRQQSALVSLHALEHLRRLLDA